MRALLLAAGMGTRLQPLTYVLPKCLVPIHGRPLLDYWLECLLDHGVDEVLINTHYLAPLVVGFIERSSWARCVTVVHEDRLLGTGGTILKNRAFFRDEAFFVAHADNLTLFDVREFAIRHAGRPAGTRLTMMLFETDDPQSCGIVELDERGVVKAFHEKVAAPPGNLANAAMYVFEPFVMDLLAGLGKDEIDLSTEIIPGLMGGIFTYRNTSYHRDIGTMANWIEANRHFPVMPAAACNAQAWAKVMGLENANLNSTIEILLGRSEGA